MYSVLLMAAVSSSADAPAFGGRLFGNRQAVTSSCFGSGHGCGRATYCPPTHYYPPTYCPPIYHCPPTHCPPIHYPQHSGCHGMPTLPYPTPD